MEKKFAAEYLHNDPSYALHRNYRVCGNHYRKTEAFFPLHILQADLLALEDIKDVTITRTCKSY